MRQERLQRHTWMLWVLLFLVLSSSKSALGQEHGNQDFANQEQSKGIREYQGMHIVLVTDVAPTAELEDLTKAFDAAFENWTKLFQVDPQKVRDWKVTAFIMMNRQRFENAGYFKPSIREFREGHQEGDFLFCKEQPSAYYRRHLLLHEGIHWFMEKSLGGWGPGWWMEGIAEWQATHRWDGQHLFGGVMPVTREELPYWGRLKWVREDLDNHQAPSLSILFQRAKDLHRFDSTYAWSWMGVTFFANHPRYREQFLNRLSEPTDNSEALTRDVLGWIGQDISIVQAEFNLFTSDLDYGIEPASIIMDLKQSISNAKEQNDAPKSSVTGDIQWQVVPLLLNPGRYQVEAQGSIQINHVAFGHLESEPQGVTLQYQRTKPLGQLIGVVVPVEVSLESTELFERVSIGKSHTMDVQKRSWLLLRANLDTRTAQVVSGAYEVQLQKAVTAIDASLQNQ